MTWLYYIIIFLPITILFFGSLCAMFKIGKDEGICNFDYVGEDTDELSEEN